MTTTPQTEAQRLAASISETLDSQDDSYLTCSVTKCLLQQAATELLRLGALGIEIEAPENMTTSNEHNNAPAVPDGLQWFTVAEHGIPEIGAEVIGGLWYTDPWIKTEFATTFMWGQCRVVESKHRDFKDGKQWRTFGPSHNQITHWARINTPGQTSAPAPAVPQGWTDADSDSARLALELECLLMDTKDLSVVSKWWASANEALELHRQRLDATPAPAPAPAQERCSTCGYLTSEREHLGCLRRAVKDLDIATGGPYDAQEVGLTDETQTQDELRSLRLTASGGAYVW